MTKPKLDGDYVPLKFDVDHFRFVRDFLNKHASPERTTIIRKRKVNRLERKK